MANKAGRILLLFYQVLFPALSLAGFSSAPYPQRIVSLGPINTENVYLLGAGDRLVADTSYCTRPAQARDKPKIGSVMQILTTSRKTKSVERK